MAGTAQDCQVPGTSLSRTSTKWAGISSSLAGTSAKWAGISSSLAGTSTIWAGTSSSLAGTSTIWAGISSSLAGTSTSTWCLYLVLVRTSEHQAYSDRRVGICTLFLLRLEASQGYSRLIQATSGYFRASKQLPPLQATYKLDFSVKKDSCCSSASEPSLAEG